MAQLCAAFGSSHSIMLTATREDWLTASGESDRRMPLFDTSGAPRDYQELLAAAPADSALRVTPDLAPRPEPSSSADSNAAQKDRIEIRARAERQRASARHGNAPLVRR